MRGAERRRVEVRGKHVVETAQREEVETFVVVDGRFVAQPLPHGVRVGIDRVVVRVVHEINRRHDRRPYPTELA